MQTRTPAARIIVCGLSLTHSRARTDGRTDDISYDTRMSFTLETSGVLRSGLRKVYATFWFH